MTPLANYLRDELARRNWSIDEFAKKAGLSLSNAYLIIRDGKDNVRRETLEGIAAALSMTASELLDAAAAQTSDDPIERAIRQRSAQMRETVRDVPEVYWSTIINKLFDSAIDGAKDMVQWAKTLNTVTEPADAELTRQEVVGNRGESTNESDLPIWKQDHNRHRAETRRPTAGLRLGFVTPLSVAPR